MKRMIRLIREKVFGNMVVTYILLRYPSYTGTHPKDGSGNKGVTK